MNTSSLSGSRLQRLGQALEQLNRLTGQAVAWLTLGMVLATVWVVVQRYWFQTGAVRVQEAVTLMHAAVFMLAAAYTLAAGEHVRVDVFYSRLSARGQALINIGGTLLFLLPVAGFLLWSSYDYVAIAWQIREASQEAGGLPHPAPAIMKSLIPLTAILLLLQGIAMLLQQWPCLQAGRTQDH